MATLLENVHTIATSGPFDRLSVMDRSGDFLYDGADPADFEAVWSDRFKGGLETDGTATERNLVAIESVRRQFNVGLAEPEPIIQTIRRDLGIWDLTAEETNDMSGRRRQPREPKDTPHGGHWTRWTNLRGRV